MTVTEVRRAPRFKVSLRVQVTGLDRLPVLRHGDISASGLFLELDRDVGAVGSVQRLVLRVDEDEGPLVAVLARVVRVATVDDYWKGCSVAGVAFQFLFVDEAAQETSPAKPASESEVLKNFLRQVVERSARDQGLAVHRWRGRVQTRTGEQQAALSTLNLRSMAIETEYPVAAGEVIRVEMPGRANAERLSVDGEVVECFELGPGSAASARYRVTVAFRGLPEREAASSVAGETIDDAFASFLDALSSLAPPPAAPAPSARHLAGELSRISLISLITLCQMERVSGVIQLTSGTSCVKAFVHEGELVDALVEGREVSPRSVLREVMGWREGHFEVLETTTLRPNRFGVPTTALLIDLAREMDEAGVA